MDSIRIGGLFLEVHHLNSLQRVYIWLVAWGLKINLHEFLSCYHFWTMFRWRAGIRPTELVHYHSLISGVSGNQPGAYFPLPSIAMFVSESLNPCHFVCCSTESTGFSKQNTWKTYVHDGKKPKKKQLLDTRWVFGRLELFNHILVLALLSSVARWT